MMQDFIELDTSLCRLVIAIKSHVWESVKKVR